MIYPLFWRRSAYLLCFTLSASAHTQSNQPLDVITVNAEHVLAHGMIDFPGEISHIYLDADQLKYERRNTLGDTLSRQPGIQSEFYGAGSGKPVIRAYSGSRVALFNAGINAGGAGAISSNYPLGLMTSNIDWFKISKTSAATRFGGGAIGGAIYGDDGLIAADMPEKRFAGNLDIGAGYNSGDRQKFTLEGSAGERWRWRVQGGRSHISKVHIPGNSKAALCHDDAQAGSDPKTRDLCMVKMETFLAPNPAYYPYYNDYFRKYHPDQRTSPLQDYTNRRWAYISGVGMVENTANPDYIPGTPGSEAYINKNGPITDIIPTTEGYLANSHALQQNIGVGATYIAPRWYLGAALRHQEQDYGVPAFAFTTSKTGKDMLAPVNVEGRLTQWQIQSGVDLGEGFFNQVQFNAAHTKQHTEELLGEEISTALNDHSNELHLSLDHAYGDHWRGQWGIAWQQQKIRTHGADRYLPNVNRREHAIFALQQFNHDWLQAEAGYRYEHVNYHADASGYKPSRHAVLGFPARDFSLKQYHGAITIEPFSWWQIGYHYSHSERAPSFNELYGSNNHYAILASEAGDPNLAPEVARSHEISTRINWSPAQLSLSYYNTNYQNYIYLGNTGISRGLIYSKEWRQKDHRVSGVEAELALDWSDTPSGDWHWRIFADRVHHQSKQPDPRFEGDNVEGLPVSRYGSTLDWQHQRWSASLSAVHYLSQDHLGKYQRHSTEFALPSYTLVDARLGYTWSLNEQQKLEAYLEAHNLTDAEARAHHSPIKYLAPQPGRSFFIGLNYQF